MVAARLLGIGYSLTLHGSDLLLHKAFLDSKLANCKACLTVSEYNLNYIRDTYPEIDQRKLVLRRLGVESPPADCKRSQSYDSNLAFVLLAAGRLHPVKDHAFLLRGCAVLRAHGTNIVCLIAGDGPEKARLVRLVKKLGLQGTTIFLGYLSRVELASLYAKVDLLVVTSRSEGIPVVLMEAMACGVPVLAPRITGIPELVVDGQTGFLYQPGSVSDFAGRVELIRKTAHSLGPLRRAAREHVLTKFNHQANLQLFADTLLQCISPALYEDSLSQQI
jgi:glycosyltransferase involved in cell wall biosynthesis